MLNAFGRAGALHRPVYRHVEIPWRGGRLSGWLIEPDTTDPTPTVIVLGGIDAWREEFEVGASYLTERGLTAFSSMRPARARLGCSVACTSTRWPCRRSAPSSTWRWPGHALLEHSGFGATAREAGWRRTSPPAILASKRAASTVA